jgi:hypothetical protein
VALLNFAQLSHALSRQVDIGTLREWLFYLARCALAAGACGVAAWGLDVFLEQVTHGLILHAIALFAAIGLAVAVYFGAAQLLRLQESAEAWRMIKRRIPGLA